MSKLVKRLMLGLSVALVMIFGGCGTTSANTAFGGSLNHLHDMLALNGVSHTVLLATHIGLYRSADSGHTWADVAGTAGQTMNGLMLFKLSQSPVDAQRVYILAIPRTDDPGAARSPAGIYASSDAGLTWKLAAPLTALPSQTIYTIGAGPASANQIFAIVPSLAEHGLYGSNDGGAHWAALPTLPDPHPQGVVSDPGRPGRLMLWSATSGLFISDDGAQTWTPAAGIQDGIYGVAFAGATVYANGADGVFVSHDHGDHFTVGSSDAVFSSTVACPAAPATAYGVTGTAVEVTRDGGQTWTPTAATSAHPNLVTADPTNPQIVYVGFSFPLGVAMTSDGGGHWRTLIP